MDIDFFPPPMPDELPYSMLSRYRELLAMPSLHPKMQVIGTKGYFSSTLCGSMTRFARCALDDEGRAGELVERHTAYPYLAAFLPPEERESLKLRWLHADTARSRHGEQGTTPHTRLLFCPECAKVDIAAYGQASWKRFHQIPSVFVCPLHGGALRLGEALAMTAVLDTCSGDPGSGTELACPVSPQTAWSLARMSHELFDGRFGPYPRPILAEALKSLASSKGRPIGFPGGAAELAEVVIAEFLPRRPSRVPRSISAENVSLTWRTAGHTPPPSVYLAVLAALGSDLSDLADECGRQVPAPARISRDRTRVTLLPSKIGVHRATASAALLANPGMTKTQFRSAHRTAYQYLVANDRTWFEERFAPADRSAARVDWETLDSELSARVPAARELLLSRSPPRRVSARFLIDQISAPANIANRETPLSRTREAIDLAVETTRASKVRRMEWSALEAARTYRTLTANQLRREIGRDPGLSSYADALATAVIEATGYPDPSEYVRLAIAQATADGRRPEAV